MNIISINALVRVTLTDRGRQILENNYLPFAVSGLSGNVWSAPLWEVMSVFGKYLTEGMLSGEKAIFANDGKMEIILQP